MSKQGKTKRNTKAVLLTASSTFSMCWIDSYCILQCPHTVWVMWITFTGVSDVNFNSSVITWKSKHVYPLDTILTFSGATGEVTSFKRLCFTFAALQRHLPAQPPKATSQVSVALLGCPSMGFIFIDPQHQKTVCL